MNAQTNFTAATALLALTVDRKALVDALQSMKATGAHIIEKRNTIPILSTVLLDATADKLTVTGTDLDIMLQVELPAACDAPGRCAIDFEAFHKAAKAAKGETVRLTDMGGADAKKSGTATLQHDGGSARLPTRLADDFPMIVTPDELLANRFTVPGMMLKHDLDRLAPCISTEETRYYLNGVFFHRTRIAPPPARTEEHEAAVDELATLRRESAAHNVATRMIEGGETPETEPDAPDVVETRASRIAELEAACAEFEAVRCAPDSLAMAATDGHKLGRVARPLSLADGMPESFPDAILPRKAVEWCRRKGLAKPGHDETVSIGFTASRFIFQRGRVRLVSKLVDGTFPDYTRVIPSKGAAYPAHVITVDADALGDAAATVTAHVSHKTRAVKLSVGDGWATAWGNCPDNGAAHAMIEGTSYAQPEGEEGEPEFYAGFNAAYVSAMMAAQFKGATVTISMGDANCPARIESEGAPEFIAVLMPMRVDGGAMSPDALRKLDRDALEIFAEDMPERLEAIDKLAADAVERGEGRRGIIRRDVLPSARKAAGAIVTAAIDLATARNGGDRYAARLTILRDLAAMRGEGDPLASRAADAKARDLAPVDEISDDSGIVAQPVDEAPETMAEQVDEPESQPVDVPAPVETPEQASKRIRDEAPMFASLQEFKAAAGQGSRWTIENFDGESWGGLRTRTVATVRARSIGFLGETATLDECRAADVSGGGGRSWIDFPKQADWSSEPEGLVIYYAADAQIGREAQSVPCLRIRPVPVEDAAPVAAGQPGELEALRATVDALSATVAALTARLDASEGAQPVEAPSAPVEAPVEAPARSDAHARAVRRAAHYRLRMRTLKATGAEDDKRVARLIEERDEAVERATVAEEAVETAHRRIGALESMLGKAKRRIVRLAAVLTGRNAQIETLGRDLMIARNRAADLRQAGHNPKPVDASRTREMESAAA